METLLQILIKHEEFLDMMQDSIENEPKYQIKYLLNAEYNHNRGMIEMIKTLLTDIDIPIKDI